MKITYFGHSCFQVEVEGKKLLFDPFISPNELAKNIDINEIHPDYILVSHGHEDHIADLVSIAKRSGAKIICSYEIYAWLSKQEISNCHPVNVGGKIKLDFGNVKSVNAIHSSSFSDGSYAGPPMGFVVETNEGNFYFAGDTALTYDMKLIGDYRKIQFALLPIGDNFTMGVENAILASEFINCPDIIGMHYDTFGYITINHEDAIKKFNTAGKKLTLMKIGETIQK